jgi:hypothetical protein
MRFTDITSVECSDSSSLSAVVWKDRVEGKLDAALSIDRLEITYKHGRNSIISPKDKNEFLRIIAIMSPEARIKG